MSQAAATPEPVLQLLTERELDMPVDITLTETGTDFLFSMPCEREEEGRERGTEGQEGRRAPPQLRVLQRSCTLTLLDVRFGCCGLAGVTISTESDEAAAVEAANKRYSELLAAKVAADRYTDQEAQVRGWGRGRGGEYTDQEAQVRKHGKAGPP